MYERILVALDGSERAEQVLPYVETLAAKFGSVVTLLRSTSSPESIIAQTAAGGAVMAPSVVDPTPIVEAEREEARAYLGAVTNRLAQAGLVVHAECPAGPADEMILRRAAELAGDASAGSVQTPAAGSGRALIAMTTHGRGGLGRLVFGSVADEVLRGAPCPVLLVRVSEAAESDEPQVPPGELPIV